MRKVSSVHEILPTSYHLAEVCLSDTIPHASGGLSDVWKGQLGGDHVSLKAFRTGTGINLAKLKWVCDRTLTRKLVG